MYIYICIYTHVYILTTGFGRFEGGSPGGAAADERGEDDAARGGGLPLDTKSTMYIRISFLSLSLYVYVYAYIYIYIHTCYTCI